MRTDARGSNASKRPFRDRRLTPKFPHQAHLDDRLDVGDYFQGVCGTSLPKNGSLLELMDGLIVILWSCVLLVVHAKHIRAEMLNPNTL